MSLIHSSDDSTYSLPPSPLPPPEYAITLSLRVIEFYVCIVACLLPFLAVFGSARRHNGRFKFINACVRIAYIGSATAISIAIGNMQAFNHKEVYFTFWAVFLLLALGSADSISVSSVEESETRSVYLEDFRVQGIWVLCMIFYTGGLKKSYKVEVLAVWVLTMMKAYERAFVMNSTTMPFGVARVAKPTAESIKVDHQEKQEVEPDRYNYVVNEKVTLQNIWDCKGGLLAKDVKRKDICLSFALYKILRCRFAGYSLPEYRAHPKTRRFVRDRLLADGGDFERPFRVIETELAFLYDFFYTKYPIVTRLWYLVTMRAFEMIILSVGCLAALNNLNPKKFHLDTDVLLHVKNNSVHSIDERVTYFVIGTIIFTEVVQLFYIFFSDWTKVHCLCAYVQYPFLQKKCIENMIKMLGCIPWPKWQRRLGQYTLLECFNSHRYSSVITYYRKGKNRKGRKKKFIKLHAEVKKAIVNSLIRLYDDSGNMRDLTQGTTSLQQNNVEEILGWACDLRTITEVILVWHVATSFCEMELETKTKEARRQIKGNEQFVVATNLSKYCAYLVAFQPRLLPDHPYDAELILDKVIDEVRKELKGCNGCNPSPKRFRKMMKLDKGETVLARGARLGRELLDLDERWKILADFWAELMLFLAPSDVDIIPHAKQLAHGGEFITHLWALLFHAGIKSPDSVTRGAV